MGVFRNIVDDNKFTPEHVKWFDAKLFFEGDNRRLNYEQFGVLLFLERSGQDAAQIETAYGIVAPAPGA